MPARNPEVVIGRHGYSNRLFERKETVAPKLSYPASVLRAEECTKSVKQSGLAMVTTIVVRPSQDSGRRVHLRYSGLSLVNTDIWQRIWRGPVIDRPQTEADGQDGQMEVKVDDELRRVLVWKWARE